MMISCRSSFSLIINSLRDNKNNILIYVINQEVVDIYPANRYNGLNCIYWGASMTQREFYTVEEIAERLAVSEDLIRKWIRNKELPAYQFGKEYRVRPSDYEKFVREHRTIEEE